MPANKVPGGLFMESPDGDNESSLFLHLPPKSSMPANKTSGALFVETSEASADEPERKDSAEVIGVDSFETPDGDNQSSPFSSSAGPVASAADAAGSSATPAAEPRTADAQRAAYVVEQLRRRDFSLRCPAGSHLFLPVPLGPNGGGRALNVYTLTMVMRLSPKTDSEGQQQHAMPSSAASPGPGSAAASSGEASEESQNLQALLQTNRQNGAPAIFTVDRDTGALQLRGMEDVATSLGGNARFAFRIQKPGRPAGFSPTRLSPGQWHVVTLIVDAVQGFAEIHVDGAPSGNYTRASQFRLDGPLSIAGGFLLFASGAPASAADPDAWVELKRVELCDSALTESAVKDLHGRLRVASGTWSCILCEFDQNPAASGNCQQCGEKQTILTPWSCEMCSRMNNADCFKCECQQPRPTSAYWNCPRCGKEDNSVVQHNCSMCHYSRPRVDRRVRLKAKARTARMPLSR